MLKLPLILLIASTICFSYLLWWHNLGVYSGIYGLDKPTDIAAIIVGGLLVLLSVVSIFFTFKNKKFLWALVPAILCGIFFSRILHGEKVFSFRACDMSICDKLELYSDGTFYFRSSSQLETWTKVGRFELKNDTVVLYPTGWRMSFSRLKISKDGSAGACLYVKPIGFRVPYGERLCSNQ